MKKIKIEWKHYDKKGETCTRCNNTGDNLKEAIAGIQKKYKDIKIDYSETILSAKDMNISNSILINDKSIEDILGIKSSENYCLAWMVGIRIAELLKHQGISMKKYQKNLSF